MGESRKCQYGVTYRTPIRIAARDPINYDFLNRRGMLPRGIVARPEPVPTGPVQTSGVHFIPYTRRRTGPNQSRQNSPAPTRYKNKL